MSTYSSPGINDDPMAAEREMYLRGVTLPPETLTPHDRWLLGELAAWLREEGEVTSSHVARTITRRLTESAAPQDGGSTIDGTHAAPTSAPSCTTTPAQARGAAAPATPTPAERVLRDALRMAAGRFADIAAIIASGTPYDNVGFFRASAKRCLDALSESAAPQDGGSTAVVPQCATPQASSRGAAATATPDAEAVMAATRGLPQGDAPDEGDLETLRKVLHEDWRDCEDETAHRALRLINWQAAEIEKLRDTYIAKAVKEPGEVYSAGFAAGVAAAAKEAQALKSDGADPTWNDALDIAADAIRSITPPAPRAADPLNGWRGMESAPKNQGSILVWCPEYKNTYIVCWNSYESEWRHFGGGGLQLREAPSHWRERPAPPAEIARRAAEGET